MPELTAIPDPPRAVRRSAAFRTRWVLGLSSACTLVMVLVPVVVLGATEGLDVLPFVDDALDQRAVRTTARITSIEPTSMHSGGTRFVRVRFVFQDASEREHSGSSILPDTRAPSLDETPTVDYLASDPAVSRLTGSRRTTFGPVFDLLIGLVLLPAGVVFLFWLRGHMRLRIVLRDGVAGIASITECRRLGWVNPPQFSVRFVFEDARRLRHGGWQWIGARTPLGHAVGEGLRRVPVVYDPDSPRHHRLVAATDFADP
jgi:hypothetical protein